MASKFRAMVFEGRETKIGIVVFHGNVKKLCESFLSLLRRIFTISRDFAAT